MKMKIKKLEAPFPVISIEGFIPSDSLVRAASESFDLVEDWVKYGPSDNQIQYCSKLGRDNIPSPALLCLDYIATYFDPNKVFDGLTKNAFPDMTHYGGGMMLTPNSNGEGGYLGMHVDALIHGIYKNWKREYSAILCLSEDYDDSFDLRVSNGNKHFKIPYKFNTLNVFKCDSNSWHGFPEITRGKDRKTLGVMYWSKILKKEMEENNLKAKFNDKIKL
jgi:hypothetical protein